MSDKFDEIINANTVDKLYDNFQWKILFSRGYRYLT